MKSVAKKEEKSKFHQKDPANSSRWFKTKHKGLVTCSFCNLQKMRIRSHRRPGGRWIFIDENGNLWDAKTCNDCRNQHRLFYGRKKYGQRPRDLATFPAHITGRSAERTAQRYFESLGYVVDICMVRGPDLTISKDNKSLRVEVKAVHKSGRSYMVGGVQPLREKDELIAYVYGSVVKVTSMRSHLRACRPGGDRSVTSFFKDPRDVQDNRQGKSGFKGVHFRPKVNKSKPWFAYISINNKQKSLGYYSTAKEAADIYDLKAIELYGSFAKVNLPRGQSW